MENVTQAVQDELVKSLDYKGCVGTTVRLACCRCHVARSFGALEVRGGVAAGGDRAGRNGVRADGAAVAETCAAVGIRTGLACSAYSHRYAQATPPKKRSWPNSRLPWVFSTVASSPSGPSSMVETAWGPGRLIAFQGLQPRVTLSPDPLARTH